MRIKEFYMRAKSLLAGAGALAAVLAIPNLAMALDAIAVTDLNMRAGPGSQYPIVATIEGNSPMQIHGCLSEARWCQVHWQGHEGWSYSEYLAITETGEQIFVPQARTVMDIPIIAFEGAVDVAGATVGAAADVAGAILGGVAGLASGLTGAPPPHVRTYVVENRVEPVLLRGEVVVGATLPDVVTLHPVPDYTYHYAYVNGVPVLVDPGTRHVVYVYF
jgi:uncharacterized protein YraI